MLTGFNLLRIGIFLSIIYFIVIPIIPEKKLPSIVMAIRIPVLEFSLTLKTEPINIPKLSPAKEPTRLSIIIKGKLVPKLTSKTKIL